MKHGISFLTVLFCCSVPFGLSAQNFDLSALSAEDQTVVKGLKFREVELAPQESRNLTYIKGSVKLSNASGVAPILGKLKIEVRMLMRVPKQKWHVIKCVSDFVVPDKGGNDVHLSFREYNKQFELITGDRKAKPADTHFNVFYGGIKIHESEPSKADRFPAGWWQQDGALPETDTSPPPAAGPGVAKEGPGVTNVPEFEAVRQDFQQQLRAQVWRAYEQSVADLRGKYVQALERAMKTSQTAGHLDAALELRKEKETVINDGRVPDQPPPPSAASLGLLRATYKEALAGLKTSREKSATPLLLAYEQKVDILIQRLTQEGKLDEAKTVRDAKKIPLLPDE